jgi:hypothetical protein
MVDYEKVLRVNNWNLPDPESEEEQEGQQPVVLDLVYNTYTERNGKTIAIKVSLQLPLKA